MTDERTKLLDDLIVRVNAAITAGAGMELTAAEVVVWFDSLRVAHVKVEAVTEMAHTVGRALQAAGWQIHVNPSTGKIDGIEPMPPGADSGAIN